MSTSERVRLVLATNNQHKVREIRAILKKAGLKVHLSTLDDFPQQPPVVEDQPTIGGNARKKAREVAQRTGCFALADDTGLFIKELKGRPGVFSARFAGPKCSYLDNNRKVLRMLKLVPATRRQATFRCVAALAVPDGKVFLAEGSIQGRIAQEFRGENGFGYDPIFYVPVYKKTFAELNSKLKNKISHRGKAFSQVPKLLRKALQSF